MSLLFSPSTSCRSPSFWRRCHSLRPPYMAAGFSAGSTASRPSVTKRPSTKQVGPSDSSPSQSRTEITPESDDFNAWHIDVTGNAELAITVQLSELRLLDCTFGYLGGNSDGRLLYPEFYLADVDKNEDYRMLISSRPAIVTCTFHSIILDVSLYGELNEATSMGKWARDPWSARYNTLLCVTIALGFVIEG